MEQVCVFLYQCIIGKRNRRHYFGLGERNDCGERLVEFAMENEMAITNTMFMNHKRRLYTWTSPDGDTKKPNRLHLG